MEQGFQCPPTNLFYKLLRGSWNPCLAGRSGALANKGMLGKEETLVHFDDEFYVSLLWVTGCPDMG